MKKNIKKNFIYIIGIIILIFSILLVTILNNKNNQQNNNFGYYDFEKIKNNNQSNISDDNLNNDDQSNMSDINSNNSDQSNNDSNSKDDKQIDYEKMPSYNDMNNTSNSKNDVSTKEYYCSYGYKLDIKNKMCYKITNSYKTYYCLEGYSMEIINGMWEKCKKYIINDDVMIYSDPHCDWNQTLVLSEKSCYNNDGKNWKSKEQCISDGNIYSDVLSSCYTSKGNVIYYKSCPDGYTMSSSQHCYSYDIIDRNYELNCPNGYELKNNDCFMYESPKEK